MTNPISQQDRPRRPPAPRDPLSEIKTRARLLINAIRRQDPDAQQLARSLSSKGQWTAPDEWTLGHCRNLVSVSAGFDNWEHARRVLEGRDAALADAGTFWYADACGAMTNQWLAHYAEAEAILRSDASLYLVPYRRQFVLVNRYFVEAIGLDPDAREWSELGRDLVAGYGGAAWRTLALKRLDAMRR